jgi:hypothetical protein
LRGDAIKQIAPAGIGEVAEIAEGSTPTGSSRI